MFLQLVVGGHLLLFVTRTERWFFQPPFPAAVLFFCNCPHPNIGGADVWRWLASPVDQLVTDWMGVAL